MSPIMLWAGLSGSLRKESYNTFLLHNVQTLLPEGVTLDIISFANIPSYNADLDLPAAKKRTAPVSLSREELAKSDEIVNVSSESNHSIQGPKNAIDWTSVEKIPRF